MAAATAAAMVAATEAATVAVPGTPRPPPQAATLVFGGMRWGISA